MFELEFTKRFLKDISKLKSNRDFRKEELEKVFLILKNGSVIPEKYKNHKLHGEMSGLYDLHVQSDIVLIYETELTVRLISLLRLGTHSDIF